MPKMLGNREVEGRALRMTECWDFRSPWKDGLRETTVKVGITCNGLSQAVFVCVGV